MDGSASEIGIPLDCRITATRRMGVAFGCAATGLALFLAAATPIKAKDALGTMDDPVALSCSKLEEIIRNPASVANSPVIRGRMTVFQTASESVPPAMLGCPGQKHIICIMETPVPVSPGEKVGIAGRISATGENYVLVDPCGVERD